MNILYIGNWAWSDGLTQATVLPGLRILLRSENVVKIVFVTIERSGGSPDSADVIQHPKLVYEPLVRKATHVNVHTRFLERRRFKKQLAACLSTHKINKVVARSAPAGTLLLDACKASNIPLYVESFEPHSDYMFESGVWRGWDPRYIVAKKGEYDLQREATGLLPVSFYYEKLLVSKGIPASKIYTVPCTTDADKFRYSEQDRLNKRLELNLSPEAFVGVYVGKFGGNYYDSESFVLFQKLMSITELFVLLLSPDNKMEIEKKIIAHGLPLEKFRILRVNHKEVSAYLSAADFGFAPVKPTPSKRFVSLTKIGEYWACGLPTIITNGIGDDSDIIEQKDVGVVLPDDWMKKPEAFFSEVVHQLTNGKPRTEIRDLALRMRNFSIIETAYKALGVI